jgi:hypothetical protein
MFKTFNIRIHASIQICVYISTNNSDETENAHM